MCSQIHQTIEYCCGQIILVWKALRSRAKQLKRFTIAQNGNAREPWSSIRLNNVHSLDLLPSSDFSKRSVLHSTLASYTFHV